MRLALLSVLSALVLACDGTGACTEIGCDHRASVTFPGGIGGPYELQVTDGISEISARCSDPELEESGGENPPEITCNAAGFELVGHTLSNARSVRVTVVNDDGEALFANAEAVLGVVETLRPNGEGCEPTCFVRSGQVLAPEG